MNEVILESMRDDKTEYNHRKKNGLCVRCGKKLTEDDICKADNIHCPECRKMKNKTYKARFNSYERRKAAGLCVQCGKILIGKERAYDACPACREKAEIKRMAVNRCGKDIELYAAAGKFVNTCNWLKTLLTGMTVSRLHYECIDCPWRRRPTEYEVNSYCPTAMGTGPENRDCLKFMAKGAYFRERKEKNE